MDLDPALYELLKSTAYPDDREVEAIIRLDRPMDDVAGVRIVSRFGPVATCRLRKDAILTARRHENVASLKRPDPLGPELGVDDGPTRDLPLRVLDGDERRPPGIGLTGAGVLVGVVDWGCDPDDPNLKHRDGTTRLLALWDQRDVGPGPAPTPYGYGSLYCAAQINDALRTADPYGALGFHPADADRDRRGTHGMHVIDIAAGNGQSGGPVGIAPAADLAFVHLANRGTRGLANLGDSVRILEAIDFIFRIAGDRPCVINLSVGQQGGPHDGLTLCEQAIDHALMAAPNRFVCQSGGNYFGKSVHASGRLIPGGSRSLTFVTDEADFTPNELEIWYSGEDEFLISVESPTGERSPWARLGDHVDVVEDGRIVGRLYHRACDPNNNDNQIELFLYETAPSGRWVATVWAKRASNGVFHAWLERDEACTPCQARFLAADADDRCTTGTIANGHLPLVVGAYDAHSPGRELAPFSSSGPTRDDRAKPDLAAPGVDVLAARSAPAGSPRSHRLLTRKSGTSMATPHVTGAVALCLQGAPHPLRADETRALVLGSVARPGSNGGATSRIGHGYLDIGQLVATVTALDRGRVVQPRHDPKGAEMNAEADLTPSERSTWQPLVLLATAGGIRDRNRLTNLVFFARHPERQGAKLSPDEPGYEALSKEWLQIRNTIVDPTLGPVSPMPAPSGAAAAGSLAAVATPLPAGATRNRYAIPETIEALAWIGGEWTRRHPEARFGVRDISKLGGGQLGRHKSHRVGLDADVNLVVDGRRVGVADPGYERHRPLVQELVDVIRANPVLPIKTIGFLDPQVRGVSQWPGHTRHLHIRFCRPASYTGQLDLDRVYGAGEAKPSYDCGAPANESEQGHVDLYYEDDIEADESSENDEALFSFPGPIGGGAPGGAPTKERVVFLPGLLGSVLTDGSLNPDTARRLCDENLGRAGRALLKGSALYPCDKGPEALWGEIGTLHWFFEPGSWTRRIKTGNGLDQPGNARVGGLIDIEVDFRKKHVEFKPYTRFVEALTDEGLDVLVFPYDWRLSAHLNAQLLQRRILERWFGGKPLPPGRRPDQDERITFIGHSLGGLVARAFIESHHKGFALTRRLITIGTPHSGAPHAYLYLIGRMLPFGENPFYRWAQPIMRRRMAEAPATGTVAPASLSAQVIPGEMQTSVVRSMASAIELLPIYDFVLARSQVIESHVDTYRNAVHTGTNAPVIDVLRAFRAQLKPELELEGWLAQHGIDYHFLAASGFSTVEGYARVKSRVLVSKDGDGTVPVRSAHPLPSSGQRVRQELLPKGRLSHARLCERPDTLAYCLQVMGRAPEHAAVLKRDLQTEDLVEAADKVLGAAEKTKDKKAIRERRRGVVLSVVTLGRHSGDPKPLVDPQTERGKDGVTRLVNPPAHLSGPEVYSVTTSRYGSLDYVWMSSDPEAKVSSGGLLFLPLEDERELRLVTFNVGRLDRKYNETCTNVHHAERQLERWLLQQDPGRRARIARLEILNRSRSDDVKGYSPCKSCCGDLKTLPDQLRRSDQPRPKATIGWLKLYDKGPPGCGHETDREGLRVLEAGGWELDGPRP